MFWNAGDEQSHCRVVLRYIFKLPLLNLVNCSYRTVQEHQGSSERSDGVHQRRHHPGRARAGERSARPQPDPRHHPRHRRRLPALQRAALPAVAAIPGVQLPQERYSGDNPATETFCYMSPCLDHQYQPTSLMSTLSTLQVRFTLPLIDLIYPHSAA